MGHSVVIVTSGAVGVGCQKLGLAKRPDGLAAKQALAAVGQVHLMRFYTDLFAALGIVCAQASAPSLLAFLSVHLARMHRTVDFCLGFGRCFALHSPAHACPSMDHDVSP